MLRLRRTLPKATRAVGGYRMTTWRSTAPDASRTRWARRWTSTVEPIRPDSSSHHGADRLMADAGVRREGPGLPVLAATQAPERAVAVGRVGNWSTPAGPRWSDVERGVAGKAPGGRR